MTKKVYVWSLRIRLFHWLLVVFLCSAWLTGDEEWLDIHRIAGYAILGLLIFRLWVGLFSRGTPEYLAVAFGSGLKYLVIQPIKAIKQTSRMSLGHPPLSALVLGLLLIVLFFCVISGMATEGAMEMEGLFVEPLLDLSPTKARFIHHIHELLATLTYGLVGLHLVGLLVDHFRHKTGILTTMMTGWKEQSE